jgi:mercuric ion transport protein
MLNVELVYDRDCPNAANARRALLDAFARVGQPPHWTEWDAADPESPRHARGLGSPTVLVGGRDVAEGLDSDSACCRVYESEAGHRSGAPPAATIALALRRAGRSPSRTAALASAAPAFGLALLPKLTCPLCWPAYAAALSALGIGFVNYTPYMLPMLLVTAVACVSLLALRTRRTGAIGALALGLAGTAALIGGKFVLDSDPTTYAGAAALMAATLLSNRRRANGRACSACVTNSAANGE